MADVALSSLNGLAAREHASAFPKALDTPADPHQAVSGFEFTTVLARGMLRATERLTGGDLTDTAEDTTAHLLGQSAFRDNGYHDVAERLARVGFTLAAIETAATDLTYARPVRTTPTITTVLDVLLGIHWARMDVTFDVHHGSWVDQQFTANQVTTRPADTWLAWLPAILHPTPPTLTGTGLSSPPAYSINPHLYTAPDNQDGLTASAPHNVIRQPVFLRDLIVNWVQAVPNISLAVAAVNAKIPQWEAHDAYINGVLRPGDPDVAATLRMLSAFHQQP